MRFWKYALAGSLGVLGLTASVQAQATVPGTPDDARASAGVLPRHAHATDPNTYGTSATGYYNIDAMELVPVSSTVQFSLGADRFSTNCAGACFGASLHLPSGAKIVSIELDYYDVSPVAQAYANFFVCDYKGLNCTNPIHCSSGYTICSGVENVSGDDFVVVDLSGDGISVDNFENRYFFWVGNGSLDGTTSTSRISVGYQLQVSPAPATASFTDVPTSSPQFQFVEALVAAGITAGCGGGNYCPNNPVTRGQMAVFLAKALGLQWP